MYKQEHYEKVATIYRECDGSTAKMQNRFPSVSYRTIQRWVAKAKTLNLI